MKGRQPLLYNDFSRLSLRLMAFTMLLILLMPSAAAWSLPFSLPFWGGKSADISVEFGSAREGEPLVYGCTVRNSGSDTLRDLSIADSFGEVGYLGELPPGEEVNLRQTTPRIDGESVLRVAVYSDGAELSSREIPLRIDGSADPSARATLGVSSSPRIEIEVPSFVPLDPDVGSMLHLTVHNRGGSEAVGVILSAFDQASMNAIANGGAPLWTESLGSIEPGGMRESSRMVAPGVADSIILFAEGTADDGSSCNDSKSVRFRESRPGLQAEVTASGMGGSWRFNLTNTGDDLLRRVTLGEDGGKTLAILQMLPQKESRSLIGSMDPRKNLTLTALDSLGRAVRGKVFVRVPSFDETQSSAALETSGESNGGSGGSSSPEISIGSGAEPPSVPSESAPVKDELEAAEHEGRMQVIIAANRSEGYDGDVVGYRCTLENTGRDVIYDVDLDCMGRRTDTKFLSPGREVHIDGSFVLTNATNLNANASGSLVDGRRIFNDSSVVIWKLSPLMSIEALAVPSRIHKGAAVELKVAVYNSGNDTLREITVNDSLGEIGRIESLQPGEKKEVSRRSPVMQSTLDMVLASAVDGSGKRLYASDQQDLYVLSAGLDLTVEPAEITAYSKEEVAILWTLNNTGEETLTDLLVEGDGIGRCRMRDLLPGQSVRMAANYKATESKVVSLKATGRSSAGEEVSASSKIRVRTVKPGISLNVMPSEIEACAGNEVNISCLITNVGDDTLTNIVLREASNGILSSIGVLGPGEFKLVDPRIVIAGNTTYTFEVSGYDSQGEVWSTSANAYARMVIASLNLSITASPGFVPFGEKTTIECTVENRGSVPLYNILIYGKTLGTLGRLDYLPPRHVRSVKAERTMAVDIDDIITADGFTTSKAVVTDRNELRIGVAKPGCKACSNGVAVGTPIIEEASAKPAFTTNTSGSFPDSLASKPPKPKKPERVSKVNKTNASVGSAKDRPPGSGSDSIRRSGEFGSDADLAKKNASLSDSSFNNNSGVKGSSAVNNSTKKTSSRNAAPKIVSRGVNYSGLVSKGGPDVVLTKQSVDDDTGYLSGINKLIGYLKGLVSPRPAQASSGDESDLESREIKAPRSPPKNEPLKIESVNRSGTIPKILDVTAVPSEPEEGTPVKVLVHAKAVGGVKYVNLRWSKADVTASRSDLLDVKNANKIPMIRQTGSKEDGYWSGMIPSQKAGTYVVISVEVTDGSGIAEDGPYMLRWVTKEQAMSRQASSDSKPGNRSVPSKGSKGDEMLFIESTTVTGSGHVSIRDSFQESTLAYEEDLDGTGTINMATERCVEKGNPVVNFSQRKDLAFGDGVLTGFKRFDSPSFQHGMGASITERFNTTLIEKSETGVLRNSNRSENTLAFSTEQAFEGSWNTKAEYSRFNKRMKLDQKYSGTFQTQKNIKFED